MADVPTGIDLPGKRHRPVDLLEENARLAESQRELEAENTFLRNELSKKWTGIAKAGSIADAVLGLYGVVEDVQAAADQYITEIQSLHTVAEHRLQHVERLCAAVEAAVQDGSSYSEELGALVSYIQAVAREGARKEWLL